MKRQYANTKSCAIPPQNKASASEKKMIYRQCAKDYQTCCKMIQTKQFGGQTVTQFLNHLSKLQTRISSADLAPYNEDFHHENFAMDSERPLQKYIDPKEQKIYMRYIYFVITYFISFWSIFFFDISIKDHLEILILGTLLMIGLIPGSFAVVPIYRFFKRIKTNT